MFFSHFYKNSIQYFTRVLLLPFCVLRYTLMSLHIDKWIWFNRLTRVWLTVSSSTHTWHQHYRRLVEMLCTSSLMGLQDSCIQLTPVESSWTGFFNWSTNFRHGKWGLSFMLYITKTIQYSCSHLYIGTVPIPHKNCLYTGWFKTNLTLLWRFIFGTEYIKQKIDLLILTKELITFHNNFIW